jgi:hypothetical protein
MATPLLKTLGIVFLLGACAPASKNAKPVETGDPVPLTLQPLLPADAAPRSMMELPQTEHGGFVLSPGFYEAEFKTYCLQPGTPDPAPGDAYLQGPVTGYRKEIIQSVLSNSRDYPGMDQRNVQLLLWSVVSGSSFNKLPSPVQADAMKLLTPKQVFQLKGGVAGMIKTVSASTGLLKNGSDMQRLFETGSSSYEAFERLAVLREPSQVKRKGVAYDQWYRQKENYYVRYFPSSYKKVRIQVYVPEEAKPAAGEYLVFDPTGQQAIPAFTNAQRLGIGAPVLDVIRVIIGTNKENTPPVKAPKKNKKITTPAAARV